MDGPGVRQVPEGSGEQGKMEKTGCKIICGVPTTLTVKGLIMMMMMKVMEECHVVAVLTETDDHNDELLSHLISLAALRPSTVTLLAEGAHLHDLLKGHGSFHCPDQLLRVEVETCAEPKGDIIDSVCELFAFLCGVAQL